MATRVEVLTLLKKLEQAFGEIKASPSVYCEALAEADGSVLDYVYNDMIKNYNYGWPKPADLLISARHARGNNSISFERCPTCACKQYQLTHGPERYCMACHTNWEIV